MPLLGGQKGQKSCEEKSGQYVGGGEEQEKREKQSRISSSCFGGVGQTEVRKYFVDKIEKINHSIRRKEDMIRGHDGCRLGKKRKMARDQQKELEEIKKKHKTDMNVLQASQTEEKKKEEREKTELINIQRALMKELEKFDKE